MAHVTPEEIVRALAAATPACCDAAECCILCDGHGWQASDGHEPGCPWRLAVEWVAAETHRADLFERFGPQFDVPEGMKVSVVYVPEMVELAEPVMGPGWFYFDAASARLLPYPSH